MDGRVGEREEGLNSGGRKKDGRTLGREGGLS